MVRRKNRLVNRISSQQGLSITTTQLPYSGKDGQVTMPPLTKPDDIPEGAWIITAPTQGPAPHQAAEVLSHLSLLPGEGTLLLVNGAELLSVDIQEQLATHPQLICSLSEDDTGNLPGKLIRDEHAPSGLRYEGRAPDEIAIQTQLLSAAASAVMCCFMGRGAPAGVDWIGTVQRTYKNRKRLNDLVYATSFGHERFAHIPANKVPHEDWSYICEMLSHGEFQRGKGTASAFREDFSVIPLKCMSEEDGFLNVAQALSQLIVLWRHVMGENALWDEMPDVNPDASDAARKFVDIGRSVSIDTYIEAYYQGVPIEDLMA